MLGPPMKSIVSDSVMAFPGCPTLSRPQHLPSPSLSSAQAWLAPSAIVVAVRPAPKLTFARLLGMVAVSPPLLLMSGYPSCPLLLLPQQRSPPATSFAHELVFE